MMNVTGIIIIRTSNTVCFDKYSSHDLDITVLDIKFCE